VADFQALAESGDDLARRVEWALSESVASGALPPDVADEEKPAYFVQFAVAETDATGRVPASWPARARRLWERILAAVRAWFSVGVLSAGENVGGTVPVAAGGPGGLGRTGDAALGADGRGGDDGGGGERVAGRVGVAV
jgi:hypothetical protein